MKVVIILYLVDFIFSTVSTFKKSSLMTHELKHTFSCYPFFSMFKKHGLLKLPDHKARIET